MMTGTAACKNLLLSLGVDLDNQHTRRTPERMADALEEFLAVGREEPRFTRFRAESHDMLLESNVRVYSMCAHHILPFFGVAQIAYIPDKWIAGLSKLVRVLDYFSHRLQVQEELTGQIADYLVEHLETESVAVVLRCEHLCLSMRGANAPGHCTTTAALRGGFLDDAKVRAEFYSLQ